ncbi:MAG: hypothetical protein IPL84_05085 [Chitinophagaceae bacterium]|nr:hypothetical protein [Chitinophagaceae bacterium]
MAIYIFSRPIHSGKTTALLNFSIHKKNVAGILMPDIDGSRKIYDIDKKDFFDIQCTTGHPVDEPITSVGKFHFFTRAFEKANAIIADAITQKPNWLIIDEVGKLELDGKGFNKAVIEAVDNYNRPDTDGNLLIVVRDSLCDAVVGYFGITNFAIVTRLEDIY